MEPMFFVMAILGCGDGTAGCAEMRVEPARYATMHECRAAMPAALVRNTDVDAPVVSAACRTNGLRAVDRTKAPKNG